MSSEKPGWSRRGGKAPLDGEGVADTEQGLQAVRALKGEQSLGRWDILLHPQLLLAQSPLQGGPHITAHPLLELEGEKSRSEMGTCICCCFCGSSAPALDISVGCPPPVPSPFPLQPVTLAPFSWSLLALPSQLSVSALFRFGPGIPFLGAASAHLCREPTSLPMKKSPFASLSFQKHPPHITDRSG